MFRKISETTGQIRTKIFFNLKNIQIIEITYQHNFIVITSISGIFNDEIGIH